MNTIAMVALIFITDERLIYGGQYADIWDCGAAILEADRDAMCVEGERRYDDPLAPLTSLRPVARPADLMEGRE